MIYRNDAAGTDPRRVVLFGDSYAHFAPIMLTALIAETFAEVHFVWSSSLDWGYVERVRPDLVIGQVAERFMFELPDDRFDLKAYAAERFGTELAEAEAKSARKPGKNSDKSPGKKPGKAGTSVAGP